GRGAERLVGLTLGTGIGGGIVIGGEIYHGASDAAGEIGHVSVDYDGRLCACGSRGCVEAYASGPGIAARAVEGLAEGADSALTAAAANGSGRITARLVCEAAATGDAYASRILTETARILAVAVANLINLLNPDVIVVAGGVTAAGNHLFGPLREEVRRRAFPSAVAACRIVPAQLPDAAGMVGAAGVFKRAAYGGP
ncbi:MAG: ROK family protein, partial [Gemmatimonadetes bacterium]|nr:ROK family protein [Gemmatimonadota bacterium]